MEELSKEQQLIYNELDYSWRFLPIPKEILNALLNKKLIDCRLNPSIGKFDYRKKVNEFLAG